MSTALPRTRSVWKLSVRRLPLPLAIGGLILLASLVAACFPGLIAPYNPLAFDYHAILKPPSWAHLFGTDNFGRDIFSRVIHAYRVDLQIALFTTLFPMLFGTLVGLFVGYYGGLAETLFHRVVDAVVTFPLLVLVIAIVAILGPGLNSMYIAVGIIYWVFYARLVAGEVAVQRRLDYVAAGQVMGYSHLRILLRHVLPNVITVALVYWMTDMALSILLGSSLGYLGLGAQPPTAEWGVLIAAGKNFMDTAWWITIFPGLAIVLTGLGFSLLGEALAEWLRPASH
ncbi:ABC transporter permease [Pseudomonas sp. dw_358]|uniref:ABC transporter permease n=1 Tax=Pseudomonas sp. dw_358 TaxID=2720083 RepID=UPI001BD6D50B|nr:ABC transporter permease [Pseudomonas sp. dw_358]